MPVSLPGGVGRAEQKPLMEEPRPTNPFSRWPAGPGGEPGYCRYRFVASSFDLRFELAKGGSMGTRGVIAGDQDP